MKVASSLGRGKKTHDKTWAGKKRRNLSDKQGSMSHDQSPRSNLRRCIQRPCKYFGIVFLTHDHGGRDGKTKIAKDVQDETNQDGPTACLAGSPLQARWPQAGTVRRGWEPQLMTEAATRAGAKEQASEEGRPVRTRISEDRPRAREHPQCFRN